MVKAVAKGCEGCLKLTGIAKVAYPEQLFLERSEEALKQPFPSGCRTNAGEDSIPGNRISF
jgi:hypothetical protein